MTPKHYEPWYSRQDKGDHIKWTWMNAHSWDLTPVTEMARLSAWGPRRVGMTINGTRLNLDDFPLRPNQACWVKQVSHDDGRIERWYSRQQGAVAMDKINWIRLT